MARASAKYTHITGAEALSAALRMIHEDARNKILADGVKEAVKPVVIAARRYAKRSERTGALRASITSKIVNYPKTGKAVGLVGPDRGYYRRGKRAGKLDRLMGADRPSNYAHLIEYGHRAVAPKKGTSVRKKNATVTGWVPARPFIRPAVTTTTAEQARGFEQGVEKSMKRTIDRAARKGA